MKKITSVIFAALAVVSQLFANQWFAAPNASSSGNGTMINPWTLPAALTATNILPGDTLFLKGGLYPGPGFTSTLSGSSDHPITIRSCPNEWAVITDGALGVLETNLPATTNGVSDGIAITGLHGWNQTLRMDNELVTLIMEYNPDGRAVYQEPQGPGGIFSLARGINGTTASAHTNGTTAYVSSAAYLTQEGSNVVFENFEITSTILTNRNVDDGSANVMPEGLGFRGPGNKARGLIVHNTGEPGIGWAGGAAPTEVNGCLFWGTGMYDPAGQGYLVKSSGSVTASQTGSIVTASAPFFAPPDVGKIINFGSRAPVAIDGCLNATQVTVSRVQSVPASTFTCGWFVRGSPVYGAGLGNIMKDCISFRNFTTAGKFFTSSAIVGQSAMIGNCGFMNPVNSFEMASGAGPMTNCAWGGNYMFLESPMIGWNFDGDQGFAITNNTVLGGVIKLSGVDRGSVSNNLVFMGPATMAVNVTTTSTPWTNVQIAWNSNGYYSDMLDLENYCWTLNLHGAPPATNSHGGGRLLFADWQRYSGFDANSTYCAGWPTNYFDMAVQPMDWDTNCFHVCVVSLTGQTNASVGLSHYGFKSGDRYELRDAQNYFSVVVSGTYAGGAINLPLNLTAAAPITGLCGHYASHHSNVDNPGMFNVFVLRKLARAPRALMPPQRLRVGPD